MCLDLQPHGRRTLSQTTATTAPCMPNFPQLAEKRPFLIGPNYRTKKRSCATSLSVFLWSGATRRNTVLRNLSNSWDKTSSSTVSRKKTFFSLVETNGSMTRSCAVKVHEVHTQEHQWEGNQLRVLASGKSFQTRKFCSDCGAEKVSPGEEPSGGVSARCAADELSGSVSSPSLIILTQRRRAPRQTHQQLLKSDKSKCVS